MASGHGYGRGRGRGVSGFTCVRFFFFAFNVIFWLLGCATLGIGIWLHINKGAYASLSPSFNFLSVTALCIAAGTIVLIVGFLGCCGAIMENQCMLLTYFVVVSIIFILEIIAGILAFVYRKEIESTVKQELLLGIQTRYNTPGHNLLTDTWNEMQVKWSCCGVDGYSDWTQAEGLATGHYVPQSCCQNTMSTTCTSQNNPTLWWQKGCLGELKYLLKENLYIIGVIGISVGVVQVLGMVAAMALFCCLRNEKLYD